MTPDEVRALVLLHLRPPLVFGAVQLDHEARKRSGAPLGQLKPQLAPRRRRPSSAPAQEPRGICARLGRHFGGSLSNTWEAVALVGVGERWGT